MCHGSVHYPQFIWRKQRQKCDLIYAYIMSFLPHRHLFHANNSFFFSFPFILRTQNCVCVCFPSSYKDHFLCTYLTDSLILLFFRVVLSSKKGIAISSKCSFCINAFCLNQDSIDRINSCVKIEPREMQVASVGFNQQKM